MEYISLLPYLNSGTIVIVHAHELYDNTPFLSWMARYFIRRAHIVIVPETNRLWILKISSLSNASFFFVPNRPLDDAISFAETQLQTRDVFMKYMGSSQCSRYLIYQGAFMRRRCLHELIKGFKAVPFTDTGLILMGADFKSEIVRELIELSKDDKRIVFLPRIPPPNHYFVARGCIGGILLYAPISLNNIYCAPNKIFEYAVMGLGMILPDFPSMAHINREFELGEVCNPTDPVSIRDAIIKLLHKNPALHKRAAFNFLESTPKPMEYYCKIYDRIKSDL